MYNFLGGRAETLQESLGAYVCQRHENEELLRRLGQWALFIVIPRHFFPNNFHEEADMSIIFKIKSVVEQAPTNHNLRIGTCPGPGGVSDSCGISQI